MRSRSKPTKDDRVERLESTILALTAAHNERERILHQEIRILRSLILQAMNQFRTPT